MKVRTIVGVDFSGAKLAGRNIWLAGLDVGGRRPRLVRLDRLENICGTAERRSALAILVKLIRSSNDALWAIDAPFGFPLEVPGGAWTAQFRFIARFGEDAYQAGLECLNIARICNLPLHVRRATDVENKTPFDCYHYRIIYQAFFGMRDVIGPLRRDPQTAVLPFQYRKMKSARRLVVEACPSSTLKRLGLPHHTYKQPAGGPLTRPRLRTRRIILDALTETIEIAPAHRRAMIRNPGGDAIDAVLAALGAWQDFMTCDHLAIARHPRYRREGRLYV